MARTKQTPKIAAKRSKQAPKPVWEEVPAAEIEGRRPMVRQLFAAGVRVEGPDGELHPLSSEELTEVTSPDAIRELIEDETPPETRAALSPVPVNKRGPRSGPLPPFDRMRDIAEIDRARLAEDVLEILSLTHALLDDQLGRGAPQSHELTAVDAIRTAMETYRDARARFRKEARYVIAVNALAKIYERVEFHWPRDAPGTGDEKLGGRRTKDQEAAITREREDLDRFLKVHFDALLPQARSTRIDELLVDGVYIRAHQGPLKVASKLLEGLLGVSQRTLLKARRLSGLQISRAHQKAAFVPIRDVWTAFGTSDAGQLVIDLMARQTGAFAEELVRRVAEQRVNAPVGARVKKAEDSTRRRP